MSKSKRNTVDPGAIVGRYGADTARWFVLSDNPPERDVEWTESGVQGAYRFVQRLYRLALQVAAERRVVAPDGFSGDAKTLRQLTHRTIAAVTEALETFAFNVAVAKIYELAGAVSGAGGQTDELLFARFEGAEIIARLVAPMMPHVGEEIFARLRPDAGLVALQAWPKADAALLVQDEVTIAVQVNGKLRGTILVPAGQAAEPTLAAAEAAVASVLAGQSIVKKIHVPDRIVNFVVKP
jgi:leucyl-tRNA synthetase